MWSLGSSWTAIVLHPHRDAIASLFEGETMAWFPPQYSPLSRGIHRTTGWEIAWKARQRRSTSALVALVRRAGPKSSMVMEAATEAIWIARQRLTQLSFRWFAK